HHPGNATPAAEANIYNDAEAARMVLHAGWNITLVPLDITMRHLLTTDDQAQLRNRATPSSTFAADILSCYFDFYEREVFGLRQNACHDSLAAALAVGDLTIHDGPTVAVDVETGHGPAHGATIADTRGRFGTTPSQPHAGIRLVLDTAGDFADTLIDRLCSHIPTWAVPATSWADTAAAATRMPSAPRYRNSTTGVQPPRST